MPRRYRGILHEIRRSPCSSSAWSVSAVIVLGHAAPRWRPIPSSPAPDQVEAAIQTDDQLEALAGNIRAVTDARRIAAEQDRPDEAARLRRVAANESAPVFLARPCAVARRHAVDSPSSGEVINSPLSSPPGTFSPAPASLPPMPRDRAKSKRARCLRRSPRPTMRPRGCARAPGRWPACLADAIEDVDALLEEQAGQAADGSRRATSRPVRAEWKNRLWIVGRKPQKAFTQRFGTRRSGCSAGASLGACSGGLFGGGDEGYAHRQSRADPLAHRRKPICAGRCCGGSPSRAANDTGPSRRNASKSYGHLAPPPRRRRLPPKSRAVQPRVWACAGRGRRYAVASVVTANSMLRRADRCQTLGICPQLDWHARFRVCRRELCRW